jgi:dihydrodipicolinate synthase/N-acetylneuraminate lyase
MYTPIPDLLQTVKPGRTIEGASAVLLPFLADGGIDEAGFQNLVKRTFDAGLIPAVNMDTGYVNLLEDSQRAHILRLTEEVAEGRPFIAGAFVEGKTGDVFTLYKEQIGLIHKSGGTPIIFPCSATKSIDATELVSLFRKIGEICPKFLGFELGEMFVPFGRIFDLEIIRQLMQIPTLTGIKHSSLERELEWERLALRDQVRPDFRIYTGNDLAIDLVMYGSDYLLGLSAFYPEAFALRDALWKKQDSGFFQLNDLIQYLGFLVFRTPVPGYKHNAAQFLHLRGLIKSNRTHPQAVSRPDADKAILADILQRLDRMVAAYQPRIA